MPQDVEMRSAPTPFSPLLANVALHGMEKALGVVYDAQGTLRGNRAVVRYADDVRHFTRHGIRLTEMGGPEEHNLQAPSLT